MTYNLSIDVQEGSAADRNIKSVSDAQHVSQEEAALTLIGSQATGEETPASLIARVRADKARRKSGIWPPPVPDGNADKIIGFLADEPELGEAIRTLSSERRTTLYGH